MKRVLLFTFLMICTQFVYSQCGNLYIAGVIDGPLPGGEPKAVQFCVSADIADLSIYGFGSANNGGGSNGQEYTFDAVAVSAGDCFWVATEVTNFNNWFGFDPCYSHGGAPSINGDDAIELFCNSTLSDLFGDQDTDGTGECWEYTDGWAVNNSGAPNGGVFDCGDWTFSGPNALDNETSNSTATTPYPSPNQVCVGPLPISMTSFTAKPMETNSVSLNWSTKSEENNKYFSIEHSTDGRDFVEIEKVMGAGTTFESQHYSFLHKEARSGSNYYRLRQVDYDETFSFSDIEVVVLKDQNEISVHPTLAQQEIVIGFSEKLDHEGTIEIVNWLGQVVLTDHFSANTDGITLNVNGLEKGHYIIRVQTENGIKSSRFIKL